MKLHDKSTVLSAGMEHCHTAWCHVSAGMEHCHAAWCHVSAGMEHSHTAWCHLSAGMEHCHAEWCHLSAGMEHCHTAWCHLSAGMEHCHAAWCHLSAGMEHCHAAWCHLSAGMEHRHTAWCHLSAGMEHCHAALCHPSAMSISNPFSSLDSALHVPLHPACNITLICCRRCCIFASCSLSNWRYLQSYRKQSGMMPMRRTIKIASLVAPSECQKEEKANLIVNKEKQIQLLYQLLYCIV